MLTELASSCTSCSNVDKIVASAGSDERSICSTSNSHVWNSISTRQANCMPYDTRKGMPGIPARPPSSKCCKFEKTTATCLGSKEPESIECVGKRRLLNTGFSANHTPRSSKRALSIRAWHARRRIAPKVATDPRGFVCQRCGYAGSSRLSLSMHISQAHRPRVPVYSKSRCIKAEIYRQLKLLTPEARRAVLMHGFSQAQRLELEEWITAQTQGWLPHVILAGRPPDPVGQNVPPCKKMMLTRSAAMSLRSSCPGIHIRTDGARLRYAVSGSAGPFRMFTRLVANREIATCFREVLASIRQRMPVTQSTPAAVADAFECAVTEEAARRGLEVSSDMGLCFAGTVAAKYWVGVQLATPRYLASDIHVGLKAWRRLSEARGMVFTGTTNRYSILHQHSPRELLSAWQRLRSVYLEVWAEAGADRKKVERRLDLLQKRHQGHRRRLIARWARMQAAEQPET